MTSVETELRRQQKRLLTIERRAEAELAAEYRALYRRIKTGLDELLVLIQGSETPNTSWLVRQWQYHRLLEDIEREATRFAFITAETVTRTQGQAVSEVTLNQLALIEAVMSPAPASAIAAVQSSFGGLPVGAYERIVGNASNGKPLSRLLYKIAPQAKREVARVLQDGLALGKNPREIARDFRKVADITKTRAELISRTETLRALREATLETYRASSVVTGWIWQATMDNRTCFACIYMSGTKHSNYESLDGHPRCRCAMIPATLSWAELGYPDIPDARPQIPKGADLFDEMPEPQQRSILGPNKYAALKNGEVTKRDLVARPRSKEWGTMRREASLKEARRKAARRAA